MKTGNLRGHLWFRCVLLCAAICCMGLGVAFSIKSELGTSPISSLPYAVWAVSGLSVGTVTVLMNACFVVGEIALLRNRFQWVQLLQVPVVMLFGALIDGWGYVMQDLVLPGYGAQWLFCILGIVFLAAGICMEIRADLVPNAGEGLLIAVCRVYPAVRVGPMKMTLDSSLVILAAAVGLLCLGRIEGIREGTLAAAFGVGFLVKQLDALTSRFSARRRGMDH